MKKVYPQFYTDIAPESIAFPLVWSDNVGVNINEGNSMTYTKTVYIVKVDGLPHYFGTVCEAGQYASDTGQTVITIEKQS